MPRPNRDDAAGAIYHALNRGNTRTVIFRKEADVEAFERTLVEGLQRHPVDLFCDPLMLNHRHLVLRPGQDGQMSQLLRCVSGTLTMRYRAHDHSSGSGHVEQERYKSFPIRDDDHFFTVCRYVERHAFRAGRIRFDSTLRPRGRSRVRPHPTEIKDVLTPFLSGKSSN